MRKVAIVGVEGSGKTVMLAGLGELYSHPDPDGYFLCPKNFQTASYVAEKIARMRKGEWPTATAEDVLQGLDWTLRRRLGAGQRPEDVCEVSCLDFAGEVYRLAFGIRQGAVPDELSDEVNSLLSYIRNADDLIVLINLRDIIVQGTSDPRVQEAMWITNEILSYALEKRGDGRTPRAAIVLSQADSYAVTIKSCGGPKGVLARYLPHVANNYDWLDVLASSAVDKTVLDDNGDVVPAPDFQPTRLRVIMHWIRGGIAQNRPAYGVPRAPAPVYRAPVPPPVAPAPAPVVQNLPPAVTALAAKARNYWTFSGRAPRSEYWMMTLITYGVLVAVAFVLLFVLKGLSDARVVRGWVGGHLRYDEYSPVITALMYFVSFLGGIALLPVNVRRLHDHGFSGWVIAVFFVLGWIPCLQLISGLCSFVWLGCSPGTVGANKYGPDPLAASRLPAGRQTGQVPSHAIR